MANHSQPRRVCLNLLCVGLFIFVIFYLMVRTGVFHLPYVVAEPSFSPSVTGSSAIEISEAVHSKRKSCKARAKTEGEDMTPIELPLELVPHVPPRSRSYEEDIRNYSQRFLEAMAEIDVLLGDNRAE